MLLLAKFKLSKRMSTYHSRPAWDVDVCPILPSIPLHWSREEPSALVNPCETAKILSITVQDHAVGPWNIDADAIIAKTLRGMKVEDKHEAGPLEDNDLVTFMFERDMCLGSVQPAVLLLSPIHCPVKIVQKTVSEELVPREVELATGVHERVSIPLTGEIEPLRVSKLVTLEVKIALSAQGMGQESNEFVESHAPVNDCGQWRQHGHVGVQLSVTKVHHECFVSHEPDLCG